MTSADYDLYNPTEEHEMLRRMVREFVEREVEPQALECDRAETFTPAPPRCWTPRRATDERCGSA